MRPVSQNGFRLWGPISRVEMDRDLCSQSEGTLVRFGHASKANQTSEANQAGSDAQAEVKVSVKSRQPD